MIKIKDWQDIITTGFSLINHLKGSPYLISAKAYWKYKETGAFETLGGHLEKKIRSKFKWVDWNENLINTVCINETPFYSNKDWPFSFTLLSNSDINVKPLRNILKFGKKKFKSKAYLHWYENYDIGEEEFQEAFKYVEETVDNYDKSIQ